MNRSESISTKNPLALVFERKTFSFSNLTKTEVVGDPADILNHISNKPNLFKKKTKSHIQSFTQTSHDLSNMLLTLKDEYVNKGYGNEFIFCSEKKGMISFY